jgi:hypothetical protein
MGAPTLLAAYSPSFFEQHYLQNFCITGVRGDKIWNVQEIEDICVIFIAVVNAWEMELFSGTGSKATTMSWMRSGIGRAWAKAAAVQRVSRVGSSC